MLPLKCMTKEECLQFTSNTHPFRIETGGFKGKGDAWKAFKNQEYSGGYFGENRNSN